MQNGSTNVSEAYSHFVRRYSEICSMHGQSTLNGEDFDWKSYLLRLLYGSSDSTES